MHDPASMSNLQLPKPRAHCCFRMEFTLRIHAEAVADK